MKDKAIIYGASTIQEGDSSVEAAMAEEEAWKKITLVVVAATEEVKTAVAHLAFRAQAVEWGEATTSKTMNIVVGEMTLQAEEEARTSQAKVEAMDSVAKVEAIIISGMASMKIEIVTVVTLQVWAVGVVSRDSKTTLKSGIIPYRNRRKRKINHPRCNGDHQVLKELLSKKTMALILKRRIISLSITPTISAKILKIRKNLLSNRLFGDTILAVERREAVKSKSRPGEDRRLRAKKKTKDSAISKVCLLFFI
jgi:hypothetical protein